ncbi:MAG: hypothetical protein K2V38_10100, partial [Gemmataceae bacterium]|nr:hypothetical protein [Gemmataceae bacterium]
RAVEPVKWDLFAARVRPLNEPAAVRLWEALFAGVGRPFHPELAHGWMGRIFRRVRDTYSDTGPVRTTLEGLVDELGWDSAAPTYTVFSATAAYETTWADWLDFYRRGWWPLDNAVVCAESSPRVAVFWEGFGPYYAKRGHRTLNVRPG